MLSKRDLVRLLVRAAEALPPPSAMSRADLRSFKRMMKSGGLSRPGDGMPPITLSRDAPRQRRRHAVETPEQLRQLSLL